MTNGEGLGEGASEGIGEGEGEDVELGWINGLVEAVGVGEIKAPAGSAALLLVLACLTAKAVQLNVTVSVAGLAK